MKKLFLSVIFFTLLFCLQAQSAQKITELISTQKASYGNASWLIALQAGLAQDDVSEEVALQLLKENAWLPEETKIDDEIKLQDFALLCTRAFDIKGGIFYRLTKNSRYALRELKAMKIISNDSDPKASVSGKQMINILNSCSYKTEAAK